MKLRGSDVAVKMLMTHGVKHIFGVPGDTSMYLHDSLSKETAHINYVMCRDERNAGYAADAYAKVSNKPGVVDVPSGGGVLYVIPAISEANASSIPLVCLSSDIPMSSEETFALTDTNQEHLLKTVTKWNCKIRDISKIPHLFRKAFRLCQSGMPGAVSISIPENILEELCSSNPNEVPRAIIRKAERNRPVFEMIQQTLDMLLQSSRPIFIAGGGVHLSDAYNELENISNEYGIPVATSINGKGSVSELTPYAVGVIGANGGSYESNEIVKKADLIIVIGSKMNNVTTMNKEILGISSRIVQVDISENVLGNNIPVDLPIMCDIKSFLTDLLEAISGDKNLLSGNIEKWSSYVNSKIHEKQSRISVEENIDRGCVNPAAVYFILETTTDDNTIFVADAGTPSPYLASYLRLKKAGRNAIFSRGHGALGYALPAAIGIHFAKPDAKIIALFGDASFGMALGELETAKRYNIPAVFMNFQNNSYGWIKTIQHLYFDQRYFGVDFSKIDAAKIAEGFGLRAKRVTKNSEIKEAIHWGLNQKHPVFIDFLIDPPMEVIPPVLKWERDSKIPPSERKKLVY